MAPARLLTVAAICLLAIGAHGQAGSTPASAPAPTSRPCEGLTVSAFFKSLAFLAAESQAFFQQVLGYPVCYQLVPSSAAQFADLTSGAVRVGLTSADNVVAQYLAGKPLQIVARYSDSSSLQLVVNNRLGIYNASDLKGKTLAVDAPTSGFVLAARLILESYGLTYPRDYGYLVVGGSSQRFQAIVNGSFGGRPVYATMNLAPYVEQGAALGYLPSVARASDFLDPYLLYSVVVDRNWAQANRSVVTGVLTALALGSEYALDPAHRDQMLSLVMQEYNVSRGVALAAFASFALAENPAYPAPVDFSVDPDALERTIALREEYLGLGNTTLTAPQLLTYGPTGLVDDSYVTQANATLPGYRQRLLGAPVAAASTGGK